MICLFFSDQLRRMTAPHLGQAATFQAAFTNLTFLDIAEVPLYTQKTKMQTYLFPQNLTLLSIFFSF